MPTGPTTSSGRRTRCRRSTSSGSEPGRRSTSFGGSPDGPRDGSGGPLGGSGGTSGCSEAGRPPTSLGSSPDRAADVKRAPLRVLAVAVVLAAGPALASHAAVAGEVHAQTPAPTPTVEVLEEGKAPLEPLRLSPA